MGDEMSKVFFNSDLHLGHEGSLRWARDYRKGNNTQEMNQWLMDCANEVLTKRDTWYIVGDVCFDREDLHFLTQVPCRKVLVLGNHDKFQMGTYLKYFDKVCAYVKYKNFWVSHMPIHEYDMVNCRVLGNIHGHLHQNKISDRRYHNVSIEQTHGYPIPFEDILRKHETRILTT